MPPRILEDSKVLCCTLSAHLLLRTSFLLSCLFFLDSAEMLKLLFVRPSLTGQYLVVIVICYLKL